jgi:hypothetical protein
MPCAPDEETRQDVVSVLHALAYPEGKPDKTLELALKDKDPVRRAAAGMALGKDAGPDKPYPGVRLFLPGVKYPFKGVEFRDGKKIVDWEAQEIQLFDKLPESVFAKP